MVTEAQALIAEARVKKDKIDAAIRWLTADNDQCLQGRWFYSSKTPRQTFLDSLLLS
ncbi:MAG: hypothetical protein ACREVK_06610 [Gammaproteobacteria bacterium]